MRWCHLWVVVIGSMLCFSDALPKVAKARSFDTSEVESLLQGVQSIAAPGIPGCVIPVSEQAFAVVVGNNGPHDAVAVAARWQSGKVLALSHGGYLSADTWNQADTKTLMLNTLSWMSKKLKQKPRIGIVQHDDLQKLLKAEGFQVISLTGGNWSKQLNQIHILIAGATQIGSPDQRKAVSHFVTAGGGLITADTGWGWAQLNPTKSLVSDHPGNLLLYPAGIVWTGGYNGRTHGKGFKCAANLSPHLNASFALQALLEQHQKGQKLKAEELIQAVHTVSSVLSVLPLEDRAIVGKLRTMRQDRSLALHWPSAKKPVKADAGLLRALVALDVRELKDLPVQEIKPHPAAEFFPGQVPAAAKTVDKSLTINTHVPGWHSTGLYARPGQVITVSLPAQATHQGLQVRIGSHSDSLWHLKSWSRMPEVCVVEPLNEVQTQVANGLGGLVYIVVPHQSKLGAVSVKISGAVQAPLFVLGETKTSDWISEISQYPAPWAELAGKKLILTVPSKVVRELRNPEDLMRKWDEVLDADADLAQIPRERKRPERIVMDEQISAGYMHSGYPIMTHLDVQKTGVNLELLTRGDEMWGFFHELGHNHQEGDWTFEGTGEVTVNLFTIYAMETVCGRKDKGRAELNTQRAKMINTYLKKGARFEDWKADPFLALIMYIQLQEAFGWQAYKDVFAEYRQLPQKDRPKTEQDKRDQWMVRFSKRVNKNLGPFFQKWGVPTSDAAQQSIAHLPAWMPADFAENKGTQ